MAEEKWTEVDRYLAHALLQPDKDLEGALEASSAAGIPAIQVSPLQGKLLMLLAQMLQSRRILEIGTLAGYSTIWLARGLAKDGRIVTLEADPDHARLARSNFARAGLEATIDLRVGKALVTLPKLAAEGGATFDLCFIDADKKHIPEYFSWSLKLTRPGGLIIVDNVVREGEVVNRSSREPSIEGVRRFLAMAAAEPTVTGTALQTVGVKGYDGFAVLRVNSD
jgi:predicted O-methyltransferase YrrM